MLILKRTDEHGTTHEYQFSNIDEMTQALRPLFGDSLKSEKQKNNEKMNDWIRQSYAQARVNVDDFFKRRG